MARAKTARSMLSQATNLQRFVDAQSEVYARVVKELQDGRKSSHWMWFIFPQILGLGRSSTAIYYSLVSSQEAYNYCHDELLGKRLRECVGLVLNIANRSAYDIFGSPDDMKFRSSMTLFAAVNVDEPIYQQALDKYYQGQADAVTLDIIADICG